MVSMMRGGIGVIIMVNQGIYSDNVSLRVASGANKVLITTFFALAQKGATPSTDTSQNIL